MPVAHRFNSLLHLTVVLGVLAFTIADDVPLLTLLSVAVIAASRLFSRGARVTRPPALPRLAINIFVLLAIANAAMNAPGRPGNEIVSILGRFLVFVILIKLFDRRAVRDDAQLITLSVFIAIASILTGTQFLVGLVLLAYVPIAVATAMYWQIHAGYTLASAAAEGDLEAGSSPDASFQELRIASGPHGRRGFLSLCVTAVLASVLVATAIFILVPRGIGSDFLGRFGMVRQPQIGFRESVSLGQSGFLSSNPTPVLDLAVSTPTGANLGGPGVTWYLRGSARDRYDGQNMIWRDSRSVIDVTLHDRVQWTPQWDGVIADESAPSSGAAALTRRVQKITMRADTDGRNLFFLWRPFGIAPDFDVAVVYSRRTATVRLANAAPPRFSYTVESSTLDDVMRPPPPPRDFQEGRIRDYTRQMLAAKALRPDPSQDPSKQIALAIRDHLRENFSYTTEMVAPPEGQDAIEFFLFDRKQGHCEYFASAMTAMCQSQGIPARVATGYLATDFNSLTGQYLVRESDAHAWVEAFIVTNTETGRGRWETFDASPPGDIERLHSPPAGIIAKLRSWYDAIEFGWTSSVIGYDNAGEQKSSTLDAARTTAFSHRFLGIADSFVAWLKTARHDPRQIPWYIWWSPLALAIITAFVLVFRRVADRFANAHITKQHRRSLGLSAVKRPPYYAKALRALARAGIPKPESIPPARFADQISARFPDAAEPLRLLSMFYYRSAFGDRPLAPAELSAADAALRNLQSALRQA